MPDYCFAAITISIPSDVVEGYVGFPTPNNLRSLTQAVKFIVTPSVTYVICDDIKQFGRPQTIHSRILFSRTWLLEIFFHITACRSLHHYFSQRDFTSMCVSICQFFAPLLIMYSRVTRFTDSVPNIIWPLPWRIFVTQKIFCIDSTISPKFFVFA